MIFKNQPVLALKYLLDLLLFQIVKPKRRMSYLLSRKGTNDVFCQRNVAVGKWSPWCWRDRFSTSPIHNDRRLVPETIKQCRYAFNIRAMVEAISKVGGIDIADHKATSIGHSRIELPTKRPEDPVAIPLRYRGRRFTLLYHFSSFFSRNLQAFRTKFQNLICTSNMSIRKASEIWYETR